MSYLDRDTYGIYNTDNSLNADYDGDAGPGPRLMGADTPAGAPALPAAHRQALLTADHPPGQRR